MSEEKEEIPVAKKVVRQQEVDEEISGDEGITMKIVLNKKQAERHFRSLFDRFAEQVNNLAVKNGFWEHDPSDAEKIALMHSELSEALEACRSGDKVADDKIPDFLAVEAELADLVIRAMDLAHARGWRLAEAIVAKHDYNKTRPYKHGKAF